MKKALLLIFLLLISSTANATTYKEFTANQFVEAAKSGDDIKLIFIFTSWCNVCKTSFNDLIALSDRFKGKKVTILAVSLDENEQALEKYLSKIDVKNFEVRRLKYSYLSELQSAFSRVGIGYKGSIPHITVISKNGNVVADGNYMLSSFDQGLNMLLNQDNG